jgi:hypothetical protein
MPCDTINREEQARLIREAQMKKLESELKSKAARIARIGNHISIEGWTDRGGWCDACAVRKLQQSQDFEIRRIIATSVGNGVGLTFGHSH